MRSVVRRACDESSWGAFDTCVSPGNSRVAASMCPTPTPIFMDAPETTGSSTTRPGSNTTIVVEPRWKMPSSSPPDRHRSIVALATDRCAEELRLVGRHLGIVRGGHVADPDGGHHHHRGQARRRISIIVTKRSLLTNSPGSRRMLRAVDGEQRARDVLPADDPAADRRMHAVVVLGREVGDQVGAALEARRGVGVIEQRPPGRTGSPWRGSAGRRR